MKRLVSVAFILSLVAGGGAQQLAFPSAQGYGKYVKGARGASSIAGSFAYVVAVTNLEDDVTNPPVGSFRWALQQGIGDVVYNGNTIKNYVRPLYIVFKVGGVINLQPDDDKGQFKIQRSYVTIAGETALGDGICFKGASLTFSGSSNIIVRHIRSRPGDILGMETSACRLENGSNFIFDHCSFSWGIEETTHFSNSENLTIQNCIVSEGLYNSIHDKGERGYAAQWGGEYATYHHNLLAHNQSRMPRINGSNVNDLEALVDYRNNVNYNWGASGAFYGGEWEAACSGFAKTNVVNNYFKPGPVTSGTTFAAPSYHREGITPCGYAQWYFDGNVMEGDVDKTTNNWNGVDGSAVGGIANIKSTVEAVKLDGILEDYSSYTQSAIDAFSAVLSDVGATLPKRDAIDERIVKEANGEISIIRYAHTIDGQVTPLRGISSGIIDTQDNLVEDITTQTAWDCYQTVTSDHAPIDTDNDGMPDVWESANGLNPNDVNDFKNITASGYSNLELYLFSLTGDEVPTSTNEFTIHPKIEVSPNPVVNKLSFNTSVNISQVEIIDMTGNCVKTIFDVENDQTINVSDLESGVYVLHVVSVDGNVSVVKMIKQ
ncbi:MAG: T9SS type A sorting domain-containing protein [Marinilabiliaceae bacterium]|nr:T9SS type A sorting domain-containing protein [Marinilabiliaceae bacterium]